MLQKDVASFIRQVLAHLHSAAVGRHSRRHPHSGFYHARDVPGISAHLASG